MNPVLRIHPAIGIARVGNSEEFYLGPETMAGMPVEGSATTGGLPIRAGTESATITSSELRDSRGALKRQAARFRIFAYEPQQVKKYPSGGGTEIVIGSTLGGRTVADIIWTVHVANKKANSYLLNDGLGIMLYEPAHAAQMKLRNPEQGSDGNNAARLKRLVTDPGPRAIRGANAAPVKFDKSTFASYGAGGGIEELPAYPKSFPDDAFNGLYTPVGRIETLGEMRTDERGRLLFVSAYGKACGWLRPDGTPFPLIGGIIEEGVYGDVNADGWFDDTGDGPVSATVVFDDGIAQPVHGAWIISTDPSYAPQIRNVVTLWDDMLDTWVRRIDLLQEVFNTRFSEEYEPYFEEELYPLFRAVPLQRWTTNLPERAIEAHDAVGRIKASDDAGDTILTGLAYIRNPNLPQQGLVGAPFMPLSMGDASPTDAFLSVTRTQYFFLTQWNKGKFRRSGARALGPGEQLDKAVLFNCLGGRFAPGIEMTFVIRDPEIYVQYWEEAGCGPFRIRKRELDYRTAQYSMPFLTEGYVPLHLGPDGISSAPLEPGDATKFMAVPWHTDYNSCATHNQAPNPLNSSTLYWSWPAQRPVSVHLARDVAGGKLGPQRYSVRGKGTATDDLGEAGRYQALLDSVLHWHRIGVVIQAPAIDGDDGGPFDQNQADLYLEVGSLLDEPDITPWPMNSITIGS